MTLVWIFLSALAGAGAMYLFDPESGRLRRAIAQARLSSRLDALKDRTLDNGEIDENDLVKKVRSEIAHLASTPNAIEVTANRDRVIVSGTIPESELDAVLAAVYKVRGIAAVENRLQVH